MDKTQRRRVEQATTHFQSIEVDEVADKEEAYRVARGIHGLILQKFASRTVGELNGEHNERLADEGGVQDVQDTDEIMVDDEISNGENSSSVNNQSTNANVTSVSTCLVTSMDQAGNPRQEYPSQVNIGIAFGQQIMTAKPGHPPHLASAFISTQANGVYLSLWSFNTELTKKQRGLFRHWTA